MSTSAAVIADHGWYCLATACLTLPGFAASYSSGGLEGDAARSFLEQQRRNIKPGEQFVVIRASDLVVFEVPDATPPMVRDRIGIARR